MMGAGREKIMKVFANHAHVMDETSCQRVRIFCPVGGEQGNSEVKFVTRAIMRK